MAKFDRALTPLFQALADDTRRAMLERLMEGPARVTDLAAPTGLALPTVLRHLGVLEDAGLIATEKSGRTRICRAQPARLAPALDWLSRQRAAWDQRLDRLDTLLATLPEIEDDAEPRT